MNPAWSVLHDAVLNHFFLGTLSETPTSTSSSTTTGSGIAAWREDLWKNRARSAADPRYFRYPMLKRLVTRGRARSSCTIRLRREPSSAHARGPRVRDPAFISFPRSLPDPVDRIRFRAQLGLGPRTLLAGVFGHLRESKRLSTILRAMERVWKTGRGREAAGTGRVRVDGSGAVDAAVDRRQSPHSPRGRLAGARVLALGLGRGRVHQSALSAPRRKVPASRCA